MRDPLAEKFGNATLAPWKKSATKFDFDEGFVKWIQKYLEKLKLPCTLIDALAWINKADFRSDSGERNDRCTLQWQGYQESLKAPERPSLKPVVSDSGVSGGDLHGASQSDLDRVDNAPIEPELPDEFKRLEGETDRELQARRLRVLRAKVSGMVGKK